MDERKRDTARIPDAQTPAPETGDTQWQPLEPPEEMRSLPGMADELRRPMMLLIKAELTPSP